MAKAAASSNASTTLPNSTPPSVTTASKPQPLQRPAAKHIRPGSVSSGSTGGTGEYGSLDAANASTPKKSRVRPAGINQMGPILGFAPEIRISHPPVMKALDEEALKGALGEGGK